MEMAQVPLDGAALRQHAIASTGFSIVRPLHWTAPALAVFKEMASLGVPATINSEPLAGATLPVTLAREGVKKSRCSGGF
jgi:trimethylamine:corrinoid methyltransferase-like protein